MSPFKIGVVQFPDSELATLQPGRVLFGSEIIRCVSGGRRVTRRRACTIGAFVDRAGTKWPSITSMWIRSALAFSASATCSPRRTKSAARMEGQV